MCCMRVARQAGASRAEARRASLRRSDAAPWCAPDSAAHTACPAARGGRASRGGAAQGGAGSRPAGSRRGTRSRPPSGRSSSRGSPCRPAAACACTAPAHARRSRRQRGGGSQRHPCAQPGCRPGGRERGRPAGHRSGLPADMLAARPAARGEAQPLSHTSPPARASPWMVAARARANCMYSGCTPQSVSMDYRSGFQPHDILATPAAY